MAYFVTFNVYKVMIQNTFNLARLPYSLLKGPESVCRGEFHPVDDSIQIFRMVDVKTFSMQFD